MGGKPHIGIRVIRAGVRIGSAPADRPVENVSSDLSGVVPL